MYNVHMYNVHIRDLTSLLYLCLQCSYNSRLAPARLSLLLVSSVRYKTMYSYKRDCSVGPRPVMKVTESDCTACLVSSNFSFIYICSWTVFECVFFFYKLPEFLKECRRIWL